MCGNILKYKMNNSKHLKLLSKMEGTKFLSAVGQFSGSNIYLIMDVIYSILWRRKQLNTLFSLSDYKFFINSKWTRLELPKTRLCFLLIILSVDFRYPHLRLTFECMRCIYIFPSFIHLLAWCCYYVNDHGKNIVDVHWKLLQNLLLVVL